MPTAESGPPSCPPADRTEPWNPTIMEHVWDMAITRDEFARSLAVMLGDAPVLAGGEGFAGGDENAGWEFHLTPLPPRRIALLELPQTRVRLRQWGVTAAQAEAFVARFELYFRRGGG